ncbi:hypothetical protein DU55_13100 [Methanosarcina mazei]|uniref:Uncharacterized protein n=1 Tax=Methanosarcina mazei TaxID=2209 RepID=A0A0F8HSZ9_METMZ|nr:hypothetical protein DU55_13100 [Methanosarcina mazei]
MKRQKNNLRKNKKSKSLTTLKERRKGQLESTNFKPTRASKTDKNIQKLKFNLNLTLFQVHELYYNKFLGIYRFLSVF